MTHGPSLAVALPVYAAASHASTAESIAPIMAGQVTSPVVVVSNGPGCRYDPQVSGNKVTYAEFPPGHDAIRYYDFVTGTNTDVPKTTGEELDCFPNVDGTRIVFSRELFGMFGILGSGIFLHDTATSTLTEIAPRGGSRRSAPAIGGSRVAFVDTSSQGDIVVHDLATNTTTNIASGVGAHVIPRMAPDGNTVVWNQCDVSFTYSEVYAARWQADLEAWSVMLVSPRNCRSGYALSPDTDGAWIVYEMDYRIRFKPIDGDGIERQLDIPGLQCRPAINEGVISFQTVSPWSAVGVFVYVIATNCLYQVTTPSSGALTDESLSDVTVLPHGDVRVVWSAGDEVVGATDTIYATTFTPGPDHVPALRHDAVFDSRPSDPVRTSDSAIDDQ